MENYLYIAIIFLTQHTIHVFSIDDNNSAVNVRAANGQRTPYIKFRPLQLQKIERPIFAFQRVQGGAVPKNVGPNRCNGGLTCCPGWTINVATHLCTVPVCVRPCGFGICTFPNLCRCMEGGFDTFCKKPKPEVKQHTVRLTINNTSSFQMTYEGNWFDSGRLADYSHWPDVINSNDHSTIILYENDWGLAACSGYVTYLMGEESVSIAFSNPDAGTNKLGVGTVEGKEVWDHMWDHNYSRFVIYIEVNHKEVSADCMCTGGTTNAASVHFTHQGPSSINHII